jgi:hypothetical protein
MGRPSGRRVNVVIGTLLVVLGMAAASCGSTNSQPGTSSSTPNGAY